MAKRASGKKKRAKTAAAVSHNGWLILLVLALLTFAAGVIIQVVLRLPSVESIRDWLPNETTKIYSIDDEVVADLHQEENRVVYPLDKIPLILQQAVIASEDARFYKHHGLDLRGIFRATLANLRVGQMAEGGSTITQQLARSLFLSRRKTITRKLAEMVLAVRIERHFTKKEILDLYLNQVYWGHNAYGVGAAAFTYFGQEPEELTLAESAMLSGILRGPEIYSPYKDMKKAKQRQKITLEKMVREHFITKEQAKEAEKEEIKLIGRRPLASRAPYFTSYILDYLLKKYGEAAIYTEGLRVYTTLNMKMQEAAEKSIEAARADSKTLNFDQAALVAVDPATGQIRALVGGFDFLESQFNRVTQAFRQAGSSFKIFTYLAALEAGLSPGDVIVDEPITYETDEGPWEVRNYDYTYNGPTTIRDAVKYSRNVIAVKIIDKIGPAKVVEMAHRLGIKSKLNPVLSLTMGTSEVTLLEMTAAGAVLANGGTYYEPYAILKVEDRFGKVLEEHEPPKGEVVLNPKVVSVMVDLMKGVVNGGTGTAANIGRPAAGKTGTTSDWRDACFIGFTPQLAAGVWCGNDNNTPMAKVVGGWIPARAWGQFMSAALADQPVKDFPPPENIITVRICRLSGLLPSAECPPKDIIYAQFWNGSQPTEYCDHAAFAAKEGEVNRQSSGTDSELPKAEIDLQKGP